MRKIICALRVIAGTVVAYSMTPRRLRRNISRNAFKRSALNARDLTTVVQKNARTIIVWGKERKGWKNARKLSSRRLLPFQPALLWF